MVPIIPKPSLIMDTIHIGLQFHRYHPLAVNPLDYSSNFTRSLPVHAIFPEAPFIYRPFGKGDRPAPFPKPVLEQTLVLLAVREYAVASTIKRVAVPVAVVPKAVGQLQSTSAVSRRVLKWLNCNIT